MRKTIVTTVLTLLFGFITKAAFIDSLIYKYSYSKLQVDSILNANGIPASILGTTYDIEVYKVRYNTVSYDSTATYASGMLAFPTHADCKFPLISFGHGTQTVKEAVPSRIVGGEAIIGMVMASLGYVATIPDYLGMGDAPSGILHPYQLASTEASATIDLLRSAREASALLNFRLNGQLFLTGYSQGGHTTMATHKKIQQDLSNEFTVTASCPMSGPYDMSGVMVDVMLSDSVYPTPAYLPYLIFGWNQKYQFYSNPSDYLVSPYDTLLPPKFNGIYDLGYLNSITPSVPKHIFKQVMIDSFTNNLNHPFRIALAQNDVYNWKPTSPVRIMFTRADKEVNWHNAVTLYNSFVGQGATNIDTVCVSETLAHYDAAQFAILGMKSYFESFKIIDSCLVNSISGYKTDLISVYPNPSSDLITITVQTFYDIDKLFAVDAIGKVVALPFSNKFGSIETNVRELPEGLYFFKGVTNGRETLLGRFLKQ